MCKCEHLLLCEGLSTQRETKRREQREWKLGKRERQLDEGAFWQTGSSVNRAINLRGSRSAVATGLNLAEVRQGSSFKTRRRSGWV
ncbi:hypothetical protein CRENBAI_004641, partial [Crenichthys baileyi]